MPLFLYTQKTLRAEPQRFFYQPSVLHPFIWFSAERTRGKFGKSRIFVSTDTSSSLTFHRVKLTVACLAVIRGCESAQRVRFRSVSARNVAHAGVSCEIPDERKPDFRLDPSPSWFRNQPDITSRYTPIQYSDFRLACRERTVCLLRRTGSRIWLCRSSKDRAKRDGSRSGLSG